MPYKKKAVKRRAARRRNGRSIAKLTKMVKRMRPEVKEITYQYNALPQASFASVSYGSGAAMSGLGVGITQGTSDSQRVGNSVRLIGIQLDFAVQGADIFNNFRLMLVKHKTRTTAVGATLISQILSGASSSGTQWLQPIDTDSYYVYYDKRAFLKVVDSGLPSPNEAVRPIRYFRKFFKTRSILQWDKSGNLINDYIIAAISDSVAAEHPGAIAGFVKLFYTDN